MKFETIPTIKIFTTVSLDKINTVEKRLLERQLRILQPNDWKKVRQNIYQIWSSIE